MTILLLGKNGQVGRELQHSLAPFGRLIACDREAADLERPATLRDLVRRVAPEVVVNAAAYTAVDAAESDADRARAVNAEAVAVLAEESRRLDALFVHYSTDYVFDGTKDGCYEEDDDPRPLGVYGATKLAGERAVTGAGGRHLVFRTSWVHAAHGRNFVRTILRLATERESLSVVDDQTGVPTSAALIAEITAAAIDRDRQAQPLPSGIYHLAPRGRTTWCGFARFVLEQARGCGLALRVPPEQVQPIPTSAYPTPARRPANSLLCTRKLTAAIGRELPTWQDGVIPVVAALAAEIRHPTPA